MSGRVATYKDGAIGWLVFEHPERHNAISIGMWRAIPEAMRELGGDAEVRVIVMRGAGEEAFVSGADISEFEESRSGENVGSYEASTLEAFSAIASCEKPVIAMIFGYCIGGGVALSLNADMRYAAEDALFAIPAARLGLGYPVAGIETIMQIAGPSFTKELVFSARRFSAPEALSRGLVNEVRPKAELDGFVRGIAAQIAENAPLTLRAVKLAVRELGKVPELRDDAALEEAVKACFESEDYAEGARAFLQKRRPRFEGR
jgi:enoyl-CoA hydratase